VGFGGNQIRPAMVQWERQRASGGDRAIDVRTPD
jgi:hypothetical protein